MHFIAVCIWGNECATTIDATKQWQNHQLCGHLSLMDGMAQIHCQLPHQGNLADFPVKLPQHIQGVLVHGKLMDIHRTFHNVTNNANAGIHSFLVTLEKIY